MPLTPQATYSMKRVIPARKPFIAMQQPVPLAQGIYAAGTVVGAITSANVNAVQTISISGTPTHSTLTLSGLPGGVSLTFAQDVSPAAMATAINNLLGASSVGVTGTANLSYVLTWGGSYAGQPIPLPGVSAVFTGGTTPAATIANTTVGVGPQGYYRAYASGNTDGSQVPTGWLEYPVAADYSGQLWLGNVIGASEFGQSGRVTPMWYCGDFYVPDLIGLDANALGILQGHLPVGTLPTNLGVVHFG